MNLKGKVKSLKRESYLAKEKFGKIVKGEKRGFQDNILFIAEIENMLNFYYQILSNPFYEIYFEENGNLKEADIFKISGKLSSKIVFNYDENNLLQKIEILSSHGELQKKHIFHYLKADKIDYIDVLTAKDRLYSKFVYKYKGDKVSEINIFDKNGDNMGKIKYSYNKSGKISEFEMIMDKSEQTKGTYTYKNGLKKELDLIMNSQSALISFSYDDKDNINKISINDKGKIEEISAEYKYDNKDNWITKTIFINSKPKYLVERNITYYDE